MTADSRVAIIIVTHNSAAVIGAALGSLPNGAEVIVVDNASEDDTLSVVAEFGVKVVPSTANLGFGNACNLGAAETRRELLFFLNPDAMLQGGALRHLVAAAEKHANDAAFNPRLMRPDGRQFFRVRSHLFPDTQYLGRSAPTDDRRIKVLSGAAFLIRRDVFENLGGFDPEIFLYCEDDDLGLRIQNAGWGLRYVHDAVIVHQGNKSSAPSRTLERFKAYQEMRARWYTALKHDVPFSRVGRALQATINWFFSGVTFNAQKRDKYGAQLKALLEAPPNVP